MLDPGQQATITFQAKVNFPLIPSAATQVCNQGTITADVGINLLTEDPDVGGGVDPTCAVIDKSSITTV